MMGPGTTPGKGLVVDQNASTQFPSRHGHWVTVGHRVSALTGGT